MENNKQGFEFTYSAEQQAEVERIRSKYMPKQDDKLEQLRKLDESVAMKGTMISIFIGLAGCLLFGGGLSLVLVLGMDWILLSVVLGGAGLALMMMAYPICKKITEKEHERIAPQILALAEEIGG